MLSMSEDIRCVCRKFKSGWTLHSMLTKVKDTLPLGKRAQLMRPGIGQNASCTVCITPRPIFCKGDVVR